MIQLTEYQALLLLKAKELKELAKGSSNLRLAIILDNASDSIAALVAEQVSNDLIKGIMNDR